MATAKDHSKKAVAGQQVLSPEEIAALWQGLRQGAEGPEPAAGAGPLSPPASRNSGGSRPGPGGGLARFSRWLTGLLAEPWPPV